MMRVLAFISFFHLGLCARRSQNNITIIDDVTSDIVLLQTSATYSVSPASEENFIGVEGCPRDCNGRGFCKFGVCQCDAGHIGPDCGFSLPCLNDCSGNGVCKGHSCFCYKGFVGADCSKRAQRTPLSLCVFCKLFGVAAACPNNCAGKGQCDLGRCVCNDGWTGTDCSRAQECPYKCMHGACVDRLCVCEEGFVGVSCDEVNYCMTNCSGHGTCHEFKCYCETGYTGLTCAELVPCPHECSGHGNCVNGTCECQLGYTGIDCSEDCCPNPIQCVGDIRPCQRTPCNCHNDCNMHGICHRGRCLCRRGFIGEDCGLILCPNNCSSNGLCDLATGTCHCQDGWAGSDCSKVACPNNCSGHGACMDMDGERVCMCAAGFIGPDCAVVVPCPNECTGHGACERGKCYCAPGYMGEDCSEVVPPDQVPPGGFVSCPKDCSGHGRCDEDLGVCICDDEYEGADCGRIKECPNNCTNNGVCARGMCFCKPLFTGDDCSLALCLNNCSARGKCRDGTCFCNPGYFGLDCAKKHCPNQCTGHGKCDYSVGKCNCNPPWARDDCSVIPCPDDCSGNGDCDYKTGQCYCYEGYEGHNCSSSNRCFNDCFERGPCVKGVCYCHQNFTGTDCSIIVRPPPPPGFSIHAISSVKQVSFFGWPRSGPPPTGPYSDRDIKMDLFRRVFTEKNLHLYWDKVYADGASEKLFRKCFEVHKKDNGEVYDSKEDCVLILDQMFTCGNLTAEDYCYRIQESDYLRQAFEYYYGGTKIINNPHSIELVRHGLPPPPPKIDPLPEGVLTVVPKPTPEVRQADPLFVWQDTRKDFDDFWDTEKDDFMKNDYRGTDWEDNFKALLAQWSPNKWAKYWSDINNKTDAKILLRTLYGYKDPELVVPAVLASKDGASGGNGGGDAPRVVIEGPKRHTTGTDASLTVIPAKRVNRNANHASIQNFIQASDQVEQFEKNGITYSMPHSSANGPSNVGVSTGFVVTDSSNGWYKGYVAPQQSEDDSSDSASGEQSSSSTTSKSSRESNADEDSASQSQSLPTEEDSGV